MLERASWLIEKERKTKGNPVRTRKFIRLAILILVRNLKLYVRSCLSFSVKRKKIHLHVCSITLILTYCPPLHIPKQPLPPFLAGDSEAQIVPIRRRCRLVAVRKPQPAEVPGLPAHALQLGSARQRSQVETVRLAPGSWTPSGRELFVPVTQHT